MQQFGETKIELRRVRDASRSELDTAAAEIARQRIENAGLREDLAKRTAWARALEADLKSECARACQLDAELTQRTEWARDLERKLEERTTWAASLNAELESRTNWAIDMERQLLERTAWATALDTRYQDMETRLGVLRSSWWNRLGRLFRIVR